MTTVTTSLRDSGVFRIHGHSSHTSTTTSTPHSTTNGVSLAELAALDHKTWLYEDTTLKLRYRLRKAALRNVDAQKRYYDTIANHRKLCDSQVQNESREFYELYKRIMAHAAEPRPSVNPEPELSGTQEIEVWTQIQRLKGDNGVQKAADLLRTRNSTARHVYVTLAALHKVDTDMAYLAAVCNAACQHKEGQELTTQTRSLQQPQHKPTHRQNKSLHASTPRSYTTATNNTNTTSASTTLPTSTFITQALAFLNNNYNTCNFSKLETLILQIFQASHLSVVDAATTILRHLGQFSYLCSEWLQFTSSLCALDKSHLHTIAEYYFSVYVKDMLVNPEQYGMCHDFYISPAQRSQMSCIHAKLVDLSHDPSTRATNAIFGKFASGTPQHLDYRTHHNPSYVVLSPGELKSLGISCPRNFTTWHVFNIDPHTVAFTYFSPLHQLIRNYDTSSEDVSVLLAQASAKELSQGNWNQAQEFHDASITSGDIVALHCALEVQLDQYTTECERLETEVCLYNRSIERFRDKTSQLVKAMGTLRNKVWYVTQVRNSEVYVRASCVAQKLADPDSTPSLGPAAAMGSLGGLDSKFRRPSSVVSTASRESFFKRLSLGYNKRRQRQSIVSLPSEITMFAPPSFAGPNKLSDRESDATRRWLEEQRKQNLCQGEERLHRFYCEVDDLCQRLIAELAAGGSPLFPEKRTPQCSEDLHLFLVSIVYSDLGSGWFSGSETDQWLSSDLVKACLSVKHAPPRALRQRSSILSIGTVASTAAATSCEHLGTPQKTCSSPTESYFSMRPNAQGGAFRLTLPPSAATSASSAPITPVKVNSSNGTAGAGAQNMVSATATPSPLPPTFKLTLPNTPSAAVEARLPDGIPISIPSCITPVISGAICSNTLSAPFPYDRAYSEILSKFSTVTSPHAKMQCLYELETLVVAALTAGTRSDPGADAIVEELQSLFRSDLRPKTLFRDLQMIAAFAPLDNLDLSYSGKMFWDVVLAALSIKHEAVECIVEAANEIFQSTSSDVSRTQSSFNGSSPLAGFGMKECGELWTIAAKEGNSVAQRELGIMQLSHPGEVNLCVMPLTRLNELFEDMPNCSTSDLDKLDPTRMAIVRHWMRCAAKAGDNIAREYLAQGGGWL
ncbi:YALIA101S03e03422g1_1 [Yarrowia lipolytica]|nr:Hypothetical protein YALI2_E00935g [Yarrowia lipolytica]SEI32812.1 YALIA101S03e03422g1_1 [Yarrowia lipolytica]